MIQLDNKSVPGSETTMERRLAFCSVQDLAPERASTLSDPDPRSWQLPGFGGYQ
jgi:hypothetical protein